MTKKGWLRLTISVTSLALTISTIGLLIGYALPENIQSRHHLRTLENGENSNASKWYGFDQSVSYGQMDKDMRVSNTANLLVRKMAIGQNTKIVDPNNPIDKENDYILNLIPEQKHYEFLRLELAQKVIVHLTNNEQIIFDSDEYNLDDIEKINSKSINSLKFKQTLMQDNIKAIEFVVRENVPWVNHHGQIVKDVNEKPFLVEANDFVYSLYRTSMTNNANRNSPYSEEKNIFGGWGPLTNGLTSSEWITKITDFSSSLQAISKGVNLTSFTEGYSNSYLYDLINVKNPSELVKLNPETGMPYLINNYQKKPTIYIERKNVNEVAKFDILFNKLIVDNLDLSAAPSRYIKEVSSKIKFVGNLKLPEDETINVRKYGTFTYGITFDKTLYATPFYVANHSPFRNKYVINEHYWDKYYLKQKTNVLSLTEDFITINDKDVFAQSLFDQYNNERVFQFPINQQSSDKINQIRKDPRKYGLRYEDITELKTPFYSLPIMMPDSNKNYFYNDNFAKIWFGAGIDKIKNGQMKFTDYLNKDVLAVRSQINAAINWYTLLRIASPNGGEENWHSMFPADSLINAKDSNIAKKEIFYKYKEQLSTIYYYIVDENNQLKIEKITAQDNINSYKNSKTHLNSLKSAHFDKIKYHFNQTITRLLGTDDINQKIEFEFRNRWLNGIDPLNTKTNEQYGVILNLLDSRIEVTFNPAATSEKWKEYYWDRTGLFELIGWGPDYDGIGTWITGLNYNNTSIVALSLALAHDDTYQEVLPTLKDYGEFINEQMIKKLDEHFANNKQFKHLRTIYQNPSLTMKNFFNRGQVSFRPTDFFAKVLLDQKRYDSLKLDEQEFINSTNQLMKKVLASFDLKLQSERDEMWFVELSQEFSGVAGKPWGLGSSARGSGIGIKDKRKPQETIWKDWLIWPKLKNGVSFLFDMKIKEGEHE